MSNPVFANSSAFNARRQRAVQVQDRPVIGAYGGPAADAVTLEQMYGAPSATTVDTGRMTYDDVIIKTAGLLAVLVASAAATWFLAPGLFFVGMIVGLVLGLVNAFKRNPSPVLITLYAVAQGVFLGGISYFVESAFGSTTGGGLDSIVLQALLATGATFVATLLLFTSGRVRVTAKATRFFMVAMVGYGLFSLLNLGLMWFGNMPGWGLNSEISVLGIPLGVFIGIFAVGLASYSLIMDFDAIKIGVQQGVPAKLAWTAAFGLVVTLVWLYLEFLRLLAILRGDN